MSIIRTATFADVKFIDEELYTYLHENHKPSQQYIRPVIDSADYVLAVADEGTTENPMLVGAATLHIITQAAAGLKGYIDDLVVLPQARQKGYGAKLFNYLEKIATGRGVHKIFFTCAPWREPGNQFHIAMGYILRGRAASEHGTNYYEKILNKT